jgi:hypothetical protein
MQVLGKPRFDEISKSSLMGGHEKTPFQQNYHAILDWGHRKTLFPPNFHKILD